MRRFLRASLVVSVASAAVAAQALQLSWTNANPVVVRPSSGTAPAILYGTLTADVPGEGIATPGHSPAYNAAGDYITGYDLPLTIAFRDAANDALDKTGTYTGPIMAIAVPFDVPLGLYNLGYKGIGTPEAGVDSDAKRDDNELSPPYLPYSIQVVPEPGTMAALGLGAAVMLRRRRRV